MRGSTIFSKGVIVFLPKKYTEFFFPMDAPADPPRHIGPPLLSPPPPSSPESISPGLALGITPPSSPEAISTGLALGITIGVILFIIINNMSSPPPPSSPESISPGPALGITPPSSPESISTGLAIGIAIAVTVFIIICLVVYSMGLKEQVDSRFITIAMARFLDDMEREKPIRFTTQQLRISTDNFNHILGSGAFGIVYKGVIGNNRHVAVKVLNGTSNQQIEEQFMAEMSTMGRTHHFNLVRLYGFCFEPSLIALVYEFMVNGSLDKHLFKANPREMIGFEKLHEIAVGAARGITYLHDECAQRIVHYDIKPGNILLDLNFCAKVADFGLAKLCNRDNTHITMTRERGTPGYAAPEIWLRLPVTHKCDVYSFGMLLFEIIGRRRRNTDINNSSDIRQWFPVWAWDKYETNQMRDLMADCEIEEKDNEVVERMLKVALCCVQYNPEIRPVMSMVIKMLEGHLEVPNPLNPFTHLFSENNESNDFYGQMALNDGGSDWSSFEVVTRSSEITETPLMRRYEITSASE